jgi:plasmid stabilization system protein ParE
MSLSFSAGAERDLADAMDWYNNQRPGLGGDLLEAVRPLLASIANQPFQFPRYDSGSTRHFRYALVRRFPYRIVFEVRPDESLVVLAVAHTSRHPDYWTNRPT